MEVKLNFLKGEMESEVRIPERLPPIDDFAFGARESLSSTDDLLSDGFSFTDSPPSSISSDSNEYRSTSDREPRRDALVAYPGRSSGPFFHEFFFLVPTRLTCLEIKYNLEIYNKLPYNPRRNMFFPQL